MLTFAPFPTDRQLFVEENYFRLQVCQDYTALTNHNLHIAPEEINSRIMFDCQITNTHIKNSNRPLYLTKTFKLYRKHKFISQDGDQRK